MSRTLRPVSAVPEATVARLPIYHQVLTDLAARGFATISSEELAASCGVTSAKLRKDLSFLGSYGTRGVGYDVSYLRYHIAQQLGVSDRWPVIIVGFGNIGRALATYQGFESRGFHIVAVVDSDDSVVGQALVGSEISVSPMSSLADLVREHEVRIGILATPAEAAQVACDELVAAGVTSVLNFAPTVLVAPEGIEVRNIDLAVELQILAFHEHRRLDDATTQVVHA